MKKWHVYAVIALGLFGAAIYATFSDRYGTALVLGILGAAFIGGVEEAWKHER